MIIGNIILLLFALHSALGQYKLILDRKSSPAHSVPAKPYDMFYSVPINQTASKPVIAYIVHRNDSIVTTGPISKATFYIETVNHETAVNSEFTDTWMVSGGQLCQNAVYWEDYPKKLDRSRAKYRCGKEPRKTRLSVQAFNGRIIVDWLIHKHTDIPSRSRVYRLYNSEYGVSVDSYPFSITEGADHIVVTRQPPTTVIANHDFSLIAEIRDSKGVPLVKGLDSIGYVELTVPYYYKTFYKNENKEMLLKTSSIRLGGRGVISHQSTKDLISRKRAVNGRVVFNNIRVLDAITDLKLNLTMLMVRDPWRRIPSCSSCYDDTKNYNLNADGTEISFRPSLSYEHIKPMTFTNVFRVTEQKLTSLVFSNYTLHTWNRWLDKKTNSISVTRNVVIPGDILLKALDSSGEIIYSGKYSSFNIEYKTKPANVCITRDATTKFFGGQTYIYFSICQIISAVQVIISPVHMPTITVTTPIFNVTGKMVLSHFGDFRYSGTGANIESHINSFIKFAVYDVNRGYRAKKISDIGLKFVIKTKDCEDNINEAFEHFSKLISNEVTPNEKSHAIISSTSDKITQNLNPELVKLRLPYISVSNTDGIYSESNAYPYFNRVCWSEHTMLKAVFEAMISRKWKEAVIVRDSETSLGMTFRDLAEDMGLSLKHEIVIHDFSDEVEYLQGDLLLTEEMNAIRKHRLKIIILCATGYNQPYILRAAHLAKLDTDNGYQWALISKYAWKFPFFNPGVCSKGPKTCTEAFRGSILFSETYNVTGYKTKHWYELLNSYFSWDKLSLLSGRRSYPVTDVGARLALGYDAVILFAKALLQIIRNQDSITGVEIVKQLRKVRFDGMTGRVTLKNNGDRDGFLGYIAQIWPLSPEKSIASIAIPVRLLLIKSGKQYEIPYKLDDTRKSINNGFLLTNYSVYNIREYESLSGIYNGLTQKIEPYEDETDPSKPILRTELVLPSHLCDGPCGKNNISIHDVNEYDTGYCDENLQCVCHNGYTGAKCDRIVCDCINGICISPTVCKCHPGWNGTQCDYALCNGCVYGECTGPYTCICNSTTWLGSACDTHIAVVVGPTVCATLLLFCFITLFMKKLIHKIRRSAALSNVDWIVNWASVIPSESNKDENKSRSVTNVTSVNYTTYTWKNDVWYFKSFDNRTMDHKDEELCLEMVQMTTLKHRNLIVYGGACLTAPNVGLFLEVATKGSLHDLLLNDSIELGWDFRYNFMRDICAGMKFLHERKTIGSHGRLKSHNCLVDGRWTIRISGFGVPTMRFGKYRREPEEVEEEEEEEEVKQLNQDVETRNEFHLLWTAPELLREVTCLDDVQNGTPAGDVYSFAIIVSEILTRCIPYKYELDYIDISSLMDLILGNNYPELKDIRRTWEDIGGADMLIARPIIKNEYLPEKSTVRIRFKKMLDEAWHDNPLSRPSFETIMGHINIIHPVTGELIDNLINLLETYSNNLEMIVVERTNELEANKARAEELLSQMLPSNVTSELKRGRKVPPETFDCATVFFSDIVDFQRICQESSPFQIVALLNETYNVFDDVLDSYDVYKVETISDSYMVVSGVPERNDNLHAGEICTMALDLMSSVAHFQIPYRPKATLQLRIGINSGPLVAGVVGVLMPRYCLFGDTVNTASRMMSSSQALCIQVSDKTAEILEELKGYDLECRGERQVKGRGLMTTYWLWGKRDFNKRLPDQSLAISLSQHKFK